MKVLISILFILGIITTLYFIYENKKISKENKELELLLNKALNSVERDNRNIFSEMEEILSDTNFLKSHPEETERKTNLFKFYKSSVSIDSVLTSENLIELSKKKLALNDSLINYSRQIHIHPIDFNEFMILPKFEHSKEYVYGDTVYLTINIYNPPYYLDNTVELIDYSQKKYGIQKYNSLYYSIPTTDLMQSEEDYKEIEFNYNLVLKNNYENIIDTFYLKANFNILNNKN